LAVGVGLWTSQIASIVMGSREVLPKL